MHLNGDNLAKQLKIDYNCIEEVAKDKKGKDILPKLTENQKVNKQQKDEVKKLASLDPIGENM